MVPQLANHCQFATCALLDATTAPYLTPIRDPHSTILIPFSPANGIRRRIFEGGLPPKLGYQIGQTHNW